MRVLLVEAGGRGGVADFTFGLACALADAGCRVTLATSADHLHPPDRRVAIRPVFRYARWRPLRERGLSRPINGVLHAAAMAPLAALGRRADVVHLQGEGEWRPLWAATARALAASGRPLVWSPHNTFARTSGGERATAALYRTADAIVVHARADLPALPAPARERATVIPMAAHGPFAHAGAVVDPATARAALGLPAAAPVVLLFGQLRPDKGLDHLLAAARDVPELHLVVAGEDAGGLEACADLLADPALAGRVVLREGFIAAADVPELMAAADAVALPYVRASGSSVLLVAYASARPVVAYPVGGLAEAVEDGRTGWLTDAPTPEALARTLAAVVAAGPSEARRRGAAAKEAARERFSWEAVARATAGVSRRALE